jgi:hypothetical protein
MAHTDARSHRRSAAGARRSKPDRRRALELLTDCPQEGCTEAVMLAHGFTVEQLVELVRAGLATPRRSASARGGETDGGRHTADHGRRAGRAGKS